MFAFTRFLPLLLVAQIHAQFFPVPQLTVLEAVSNQRLVPAAPGAFVSITSPGRNGVLRDHLADVRIVLQGSDGIAAPMTAIAPPKNSSAEIFAALPATAAIGPAKITVTAPSFNETAAIEIAPVAPGIFTVNQAGNGPALALRADGSPLTLTAPAIPGTQITLFATGLGGVSADEVSVEVAGQPATILYAGPQGLAGLDQINAIVPNNAPLGCYVPVAIRIHDALSNYATIAINTTPAACPHPLGLSASDLSTLESGGSVPLAYFRMGTARIHRNDTADLWMMRVDATGAFEASGSLAPDPLFFSCQAPPQYAGFNGSVEPDDAGAILNLSTPSGQILPMQLSPGGPYSLISAQTFSSGSWQLSAPGGADIRSFSQAFRIPPFPQPKAERQGQNLQITWDVTGMLPADTVTVGSCRARATDGRLTIPAPADPSDLALVLTPQSRRIFHL